MAYLDDDEEDNPVIEMNVECWDHRTSSGGKNKTKCSFSLSFLLPFFFYLCLFSPTVPRRACVDLFVVFAFSFVP